MPGEMDVSRARWIKSSRSGSDGGNCVEVAVLEDHVGIRDSKQPDGPMLILSKEAFRTFLRAIKAGEIGNREVEPDVDGRREGVGQGP